jgi:rsbT antagonist protein RsbS
MSIPILKQGSLLVATIQGAVTDANLMELRDALAERVGRLRMRGVLVDVSALDVMDSFATRMLRNIAYTVKLRGAETVIVGIQPDVAFTMVQLGLTLEGVETALDFDEGAELLARKIAKDPERVE